MPVRSLLLLLGLAAASWAKPAGAWEQWDGCTLVEDRFFDGDSFQIRHGRKIAIVRLYFVDAPETDAGYAGRVDEQAAYFGVGEGDVLRGGASAKGFAAKWLAQPFRVRTRGQSAPGASRSERFYGIVERGDRRLDAALVEAGLARVTSEEADFPDLAAGQSHARRLRALEQKAAQERRGLWAKSGRTDRQATLAERLKPRIFKPVALPDPHKVNVNVASLFDLEALPGVGAKTAVAIVRARPLRSFEDLDAVPGLGAKKIAALRELVSFE